MLVQHQFFMSRLDVHPRNRKGVLIHIPPINLPGDITHTMPLSCTVRSDLSPWNSRRSRHIRHFEVRNKGWLAVTGGKKEHEEVESGAASSILWLFLILNK